jgi:hypothetical protein
VTPNRTFYAVAKDAKEMSEWMNILKSSIAQTLENFFEENSKVLLRLYLLKLYLSKLNREKHLVLM